MSEAVAAPLVNFTVLVDPAEVAAFTDALGLPATPEPPPTFAIRFLFHPDARVALAAYLPADGTLPIHVGQRFRYQRALRPGESILCALSAVAADERRPFALLRLELSTPDGEAIGVAESEIAMAAPGQAWDSRGASR